MHRVKVHDYLGIDLNYKEQGTVESSMIKYLYNFLQEYPEQLGTTAATLSADHIFTLHDEGETQYLPED